MSITVVGAQWVKARKLHQCSVCLEDTIQPGDRYHRSTTLDEGVSAFTWRMDAACDALWSAWWARFGRSEELMNEGCALDMVEDFRDAAPDDDTEWPDDFPAICRERWGVPDA